MKLAVRCIVQKSRPSSNTGVRDQKLRLPGTKNDKVQHFFRSSPRGRGPQGPCVRCIFGKTSLA